MRHAEMIAWPGLYAGEVCSPARFGAWLAPRSLQDMGYTAWCVLDSHDQPWAWGLAAPGAAQEVLSRYGFRLPAACLLDLEQSLRDALGDGGWRGERFGLIGPRGDRARDPRLRLERSLFRALGLMSESVQLNLSASETTWWVAKRAMTKAIDPGLFDACVAGGLSAHEAPVMALLREAGEEAGLAVALTSRARFLGLVRVFRVLQGGLLIERVWTYSLRAPAECRPRPVDGEVSGFEQRTGPEIESEWREGRFNHEAAVASLCFG